MKQFLLILISLFFSKLNSQTILVYDEDTNKVLTYLIDENDETKPFFYSSSASNSDRVNIYDSDNQLAFYYENRSIYLHDDTKLAYVEFDSINETYVFYDNYAKKKLGFMEVFNVEDHVVSEIYNRNDKLIHKVVNSGLTANKIKLCGYTFVVMSYLPLLFENSNF